MPELWIDPWSISWLWEKSCISLSVTYQTQIGFWCRVFRFILILMLYSHISCMNAFIYSFVSRQNEKWTIKQEKWISHLFGRQRPRWFVWLFTEMCMVHVGSHWGDSAGAQLVLMLVSKPRVYIFTHEALHRLHHVLKVLGVGCRVAFQVYLNLQKKTHDSVSRNTNSRVQGAYFTITAVLESKLTDLDLPRIVFVFFLVLKIEGHSHPLLSLLLPQSWIKAVTVRLIIYTHARMGYTFLMMTWCVPLLTHVCTCSYPRHAAVAEETCSWSKPFVWFQGGLLSAVGSEP